MYFFNSEFQLQKCYFLTDGKFYVEINRNIYFGTRATFLGELVKPILPIFRLSLDLLHFFGNWVTMPPDHWCIL